MTSRASLVGLTEFFYRVFRRLPLCDVTGPRIFEVCRCLPSFTVFFSCAFQPVGLFSVGIGFQQVLTGFNRVSRDDPVAAWMYRRRLFVGTKNKTLGTSTTRRYRVLTYRVSVSSSGLAVAKHRRPPPEGERQFLFLFFSFLFFFCFRFCSLSFFCGCGGTTQSSSASSYWTAAGQWQLRETISSCGFVTFTAFFFFFPKKFHFDGSRAKPAFRFFFMFTEFSTEFLCRKLGNFVEEIFDPTRSEGRFFCCWLPIPSLPRWRPRQKETTGRSLLGNFFFVNPLASNSVPCATWP